MNIKRAKQEIRDSIEAYLSKDEFGEYRIPAIRQRPILLMGPPGIGKTQIMEQIARECGIALVSYTITHHTRQSAVGLPFIVKKNYGEEEFSVTEYTMSEIISSVYDKMEKTGLKEGILFIDEINCVSETLAPMMLQFLQGKTFGNQKVPEGWVIVTAGNPPEYNKSVREFDVVTLDRIKKIDVEADFDVWKEYAYQQGIHPAVISYLELRRKNFYRVENTVDGKIFATARGWEDLSRLIQVYEILGKTVDREVVSQYIQHRMIAKDFASYLAKSTGQVIDPNSIFDCQVKRMHEYKRQHLNALNIAAQYLYLKENPNADFIPKTYIFGAKAAPGYYMAKQMIRMICKLGDLINNDPAVRDKLRVVYLEEYCVSLSEHLMPAAEVSEQISLAGTEASGTGNMKFMLNGAITLGTLDGANVEMHQVLGDENMFLFGLTADEAARLRQSYDPYLLYTRDPVLHRVLDQLKIGFRDGVSYEDLYQRLVNQDEYLLLADYRAYCDAERRMAEAYENREGWNRMSLRNIARSGIFAADRAVAEYADNIWHVPHR